MKDSVSKRNVIVNRTAFQIDGKPVYLYSGECEYYRVPCSQWKDSLKKLKEANCNTVCTYIPWNWHETKEGNVDFEGHDDPQRGLIPFLDMVSKQNLYLIFRPGPYICNEWLNGGIPSWLLSKHPEILALSSNGRPLPSNVMYPPITYLHPIYLDYINKWYDAVFRAVNKYMYTKGGPIICVYLDDEPSYWWGLWDSLLIDYNSVVIGKNGKGGFFQNWLQQQYLDITSLNKIYQSSYKSFGEIEPPYNYPESKKELLRSLDWYWCKLSMIDEYVAKLYDLVKEKGVDVPIAILNVYLLQHMAWSKFMNFARKRGLEIMHSTETYWSMVYMTTDAREDKIGNIVAQHELYKSAMTDFSSPRVCIEMQAGVAYHETQQQLKSLYLLSLAHGIDGFNFFNFAGGINPPNFGYLTGGFFDIGSPVGVDGEVRPAYNVIKELGQWMDTHSKILLPTETRSDIAVGYYEPYEACSYQGDTLKCGLRDDYRDFFDHYCGYYLCQQQYNAGLLTLLSLSGINYTMLDLQFSSIDQMLRFPQLWVIGLDFMEIPVQKRLISYVEQGGHLIILPRVPIMDEKMNPCKYLGELFPATPLSPLKGTKWGRMTPSGTVSTINGYRLLVRDYIDHFKLNDDCEVIAYDEANLLNCSYSRKYGNGKATLIGFKLQYAWSSKFDHARFILWLLEKDGIKRSAFSENLEVIVTERIGDNKGFLFIINPNALPQDTKISYTDPKTNQLNTIPKFIKKISLPDQCSLALALNMSIGKQREIIYCTSEILSCENLNSGDVKLLLSAPLNTWGELAIQSNQKVKFLFSPLTEFTEYEEKPKGITYITYFHAEEKFLLIISQA